MPPPVGASIVEYFAEHEGYKCGYCKQEDTNFSHGMWGHVLTPGDYQDLIDRGWRRSGQYCYKPTMARTCCPLFTIKCAATNFQLSKSQKKVLKKFRNFCLHGKRPASAGEMDKEEKVEASEEVDMDAVGVEELQRRSEKMETALGLQGVENLCQKTRTVPDQGQTDGVVLTNCKESLELSRQGEEAEMASTPSEGKSPTPGLGPDPNKPRPGKAKALRKARRQARQAACPQQVLLDVAGSRPGAKDKERSVDDWLGLVFGDPGPAGVPAHSFSRRLVPADETDPMFRETFEESLKVYQRYQQVIHGDSLDKCTAKQFKRFLCKSPLVAGQGLGSFHQHYLLDGRIVAVGVIDILPRCLSSVYLYYDPAFQFLSLGTLTSLLEVELVRSLARSSLPSVTSYYLGFYIHSCVKMRYKGRYSPSFLACPETYRWQPLAAATALLDRATYSRLDPEPGRKDPEAPGADISGIGVLFCRQATTWRQYKLELEEEGEDEKDGEEEEVREYVGLVGLSIAKRMLLYRPG